MIFSKIFSIFFSPDKSLGQAAENEAAKFLKKEKSFKILEKNWRYKRDEIDIIAYDKFSDALVFVEVKCRPEYAKVQGFYAATTKQKAAALRRCANAYLAKNTHSAKSHRFDVVEVIHDGSNNFQKINHFENVNMR